MIALVRKYQWLGLGALIMATAVAASDEVTRLIGGNSHEGVASCATSVCHGKVSPHPSSTVWLNEYRIWLREDYHSRAFRTLQSEQSKAIATKLGLPSAAGAKICLDCHADNVDANMRGRRFQISDGVGCEACHGGAGNWLASHAETGTTHQDNLNKGMYPTEDPVARSRLCLSCHLGTEEKFATHTIMGAGHPRLAFELETFTVNQPRHYEVDSDYKRRKAAVDSITMWLTGLAVATQQTMELLQSPVFLKPGTIPEPSFYQCHACHHPMDDLRWAPEGDDALPPGSIRLNDASLTMLTVVLEVLQPSTAQQLAAFSNELHQASVESRDAVAKQAEKVSNWLQPVVTELAKGPYTKDTMVKLRAGILGSASKGRLRHFTTAEQAFLAVETLCIALGDATRLEAPLNALFATVENENTFVPLKFSVAAARLQTAL